MTTNAFLVMTPPGQAGRSSRRSDGPEHALANRPESMSCR